MTDLQEARPAAQAREALSIESELARFDRMRTVALQMLSVGRRPEAEQLFRGEVRGLRNAGRFADAAVLAAFFLQHIPRSCPIWMEFGRVLKSQGRFDEAIDCFRQVQSLDPEFATAPLLIGYCVLEKSNGPAPESREYCDSLDFWSESIDPRLPVELFNTARELAKIGMFKETLDCCLFARKFMPDRWEAHYLTATTYLSMENYGAGSAAIMSWFDVSVKHRNLVVWHGENLRGKTLLVINDHGFGDLIQLVRFLPIVTSSSGAGKVFLFLDRSLRRFIGDIPNVEITSAIPQYDYLCGLFTLPHILGFHPLTLPRPIPYLRAEPELTNLWADRLPKGGFRIGIVWRSSKSEERSLPLACYAPIARLPGVKLISLQMVHGLEQLQQLPEGMSVTTLGPQFNGGPDNFVDTAAVIQNLDLTISVDTSVAHVAGALGLPVWLILDAVNDWRWMQKRKDTPWYPTMRLFRQNTTGEWGEVIDRVAREVAKLASAKIAAAPRPVGT